MEAGAPCRAAGNDRPLASSRIQAVLALDLAEKSSCRQKADEQGTSRVDLLHGCGESRLGCAAHSRRVEKLGFDISERTVLRWMRKAPRNPEPAKRWVAFLRNHREAIAAMDFFTVPTLTFGVLYCFFLIAHDRRRILHFNVTRHPTSAWVSQQLREAFPFDSAPRYLIHDRDATFSSAVVETAKILGVKSVRTSFKSPWQNGVAERFVGSCRRDLLDHVIVLNERHLKRLMTEYVRYYHDDRTHLGLVKQTPACREVAKGTAISAKVISIPRLGGLHHRYDLAA